jgi:hypothetical protein
MTSMRCLTRVLIPVGLLAAAVPLAAQRGPTIVATAVPPEVLALACAPTVAPAPQPAVLRVTGGQDTHARQTYGPGDLVTINAGIVQGIDVGEEYFVRRRQVTRGALHGAGHPATVHTAGWIRVYAVDDEMSLATVTHVCDSIQVGDYLDRFELPEVPPQTAERLPAERDNYGRVLLGTDGRRTFGRGDFLIVDRGSDHGIIGGANLVIYRDKRQDQNFLYELGEAVAVSVQPGTSTLRVTLSRDGILEGDYVALRRQATEGHEGTK